jgi:hypothetical protein
MGASRGQIVFLLLGRGGRIEVDELELRLSVIFDSAINLYSFGQLTSICVHLQPLVQRRNLPGSISSRYVAQPMIRRVYFRKAK